MRGKELSPFSSLKGISGPFPLPGAERETNICVLRTGAQLQQEKHKLKVNGEKMIFLGNLSLITPLKQLGLPKTAPQPPLPEQRMESSVSWRPQACFSFLTSGTGL